jgi:hypothetical protein
LVEEEKETDGAKDEETCLGSRWGPAEKKTPTASCTSSDGKKKKEKKE